MAEIDLRDARESSERRGGERKKLIVDVRFERGDGTGIANTRDIGSGGLYMTTTAPLQQGETIALAMTVGGRDLDLLGTVVYVDPGHGVGVRFKELAEDVVTALRTELGLE